MDDRRFTRELSVHDRRELRAIKDWASSLKTLIVDIFHSGGQKYKDFVANLEDIQEFVDLMLEEKLEKPVKRNLKLMKSFFDMGHRLLNIHQTTSGTGNILLSLINSLEFKNIFGTFEAELISQSHKMGR